MAPTVQRPGPPYVQIADYYREQITQGALAEGDRLPSVAQIANDWGVALGTAHKAMQYLQAGQLVDIAPRGTTVRQRRVTPAPHDRVRMTIDGQTPEGESADVREAGFTRRLYIARILGLDDDSPVVRREQVTYRERRPVMLAVHWLPGEFGDAAPELVSTEPLSTIMVIQRATGRTVQHGTDAVTARGADEREAAALGIDPGSHVLAVVWTYNDDDSVLEYGEYVSPAEHVVTYQYEVMT